MVNHDDSDSGDDLESLELEEDGMGEDNMSVFIQRYLTSITKPLNRQISELKAQVAGIDTIVSQVNDRVKTTIAGQDASIADMQASVIKMQQEVEEVRTCLKRTEALEATVPKLESEVGRATERHRNLQAAVYELDQELKNNGQITNRLKSELGVLQSNTNNKIDTTKQELLADVQNLASDHDATVQAVRAAEKFQVETRRDLLALTSAFEKQVRRDDGGANRADKAIAQFEVKIRNVDKQTQQNVDQLKAAKTSAHTLQSLVQQLHKSHTILEHQHRDTAKKQDGMQDRVDSMGIKLNNVASTLGEEDEGEQRVLATSEFGSNQLGNFGGTEGTSTTMGRPTQPGRKDIWGTVERLKDQILNNTTGVQNLDQMIQVHSDQLSAMDSRAAGLETSVAGAKESAHRLNETVVKRLGALENMFNHNEQVNRQYRERHTQELHNLQQSTSSRLDDHDMELESGKAVMTKNAREVDATGNRVRSLQGDFKATNEDIAKLRQTLELTQQYWKGLAKGFKQTRRQVKDDQELGNIKGATTLPQLPASARPSNAGSMLARTQGSGSMDGRPSSMRKDRTPRAGSVEDGSNKLDSAAAAAI